MLHLASKLDVTQLLWGGATVYNESTLIRSTIMSSNKKNKKREEQATESCPVSGEGCGGKNVAIYDRGFCQVGEVLETELKEGTNRIYIKVPTTYQADSLTVNGVEGPEGSSLKIKSISYRNAERLNSDGILSRSRGEQVVIRTGLPSDRSTAIGTLLFASQTGQGDREVGILSKGTPNILDGSVFLIKTPANTPLFIELPKLPEGLSEEPSLELEVEASKSGTYRLNANFRAGNINWTAKHSLTYDPDKNELSAFNTFASITNNSGLDFQDVELSLLSGFSDVDNEMGDGGRMRAKGARMPMAAFSESVPTYDSAEVEAVGETKSFDVKGTVSLSKSTQVPLIAATAVPARREFFVEPASLQLVASQKSVKQDASVRLHLTNTAEGKLGTPLPAGKLLINQKDSKGRLRLTSSTSLPYVPAGETIAVLIGTSQDVKVERKLLKAQESISEPVSEEIKTDALPDNALSAEEKAYYASKAAYDDAPSLHPKPKFVTKIKTTIYDLQILVTNFKKEGVGVLVNEQLPKGARLLQDSFMGLTQSSPVELKSGFNGDSFTLAVTVASGKDNAVEITYTVETKEEIKVPVEEK